MKKWFLFFTLCIQSFLFSLPLQDPKITQEALAELASYLDIPQTEIIQELQRSWLRKPGQERWEMEELSFDQKQLVLNWAKKQRLFESWEPSCNTYDKALILGGSTSCMESRLNYLKKLWIQGTRFHEIVWLTGDRPLDKRVDDLTDVCKNESEASCFLFEKAELPEAMRNLPVIFVAVPLKKEGNSIQRPNTKDTILAWLKTNPNPCKTLFVSSQPFCGYQFAVIKTCLPDSFDFDVVGKGVNPDNYPRAASITLDTIARWIYTK